MRRQGEFDELELSHQDIRIHFEGLHGLQLDVGINTYTPTTIQQITGSWEATFEQLLTQRTKGIAPLYLEMEVQGSQQTNEELLINTHPIMNEDQEVCFLGHITIPDPQRMLDMALLHSDEFGDTQWILPDESMVDGDDRRQFSFRIPRPDRVLANDQPGRFGNPGKQMLRMVVWAFDLTDDHFDDKETPRRNYRLFHLRRRNPGDWIFEAAPQNSANFWANFNRQHGPTLLLIHGTHGTSSFAFNDLIRDGDIMEKIYQKYGDRILAFNHPTGKRGVIHNAQRLKKYLAKADDVPIQMDILTRSRGALIARYLLEKDELPDHIHINGDNRLVMLCAPNQGTPSAESKHWIRTLKINAWINKLTANNRMTFNENQRRELLYELNYIKALLQKDRKGLVDHIPLLKGFVDQQPKSKFMALLNNENAVPRPAGQLPQYFVVGAVFDPKDKRVDLGKHRRDKLVHNLEEVFRGELNDGIVPIRHALMQHPDLPKSPNFHLPPANVRIIREWPNIHHNNYPTHQMIRKTVLEFLL